jgi:hypothetical protein
MNKFGVAAVFACSLVMTGGHPMLHKVNVDPPAESVFADVYPESRSVFRDVYGDRESSGTLIPDVGGRRDKPSRVPLQK